MWKSTADLLDIQDDVAHEIAEIKDILATLANDKSARGYSRLLRSQLDQLQWLYDTNAAELKRAKELT